jgi:Na+-transporting NADH:ubiquinone oxidoreductase subunit C
VPDPQPNATSSMTNSKTLIFMIGLSFVCALILSLLASALAKPQEIAKDLDRSKQMLIAAKILNHEGRFLTTNAEGKTVFAKYEKGGVLVPTNDQDYATQDQILEIYRKRLIPLLVNDKGDTTTFQQAKLDETQYVSSYRTSGYYKQPLKLLYAIMPNPKPGAATDPNTKPMGYVIPINGFGLWDAIYGYLAIEPDGNTVIGISWYDQKETPGLGGNIAESEWQNLFPGKKIFQENFSGETDFKTAPLGINVVKGKVSEVFGNSPKSKSAVDGMTGATLTGNGVTDAYREVLAPYRNFFIKVNEQVKNPKKKE